MPLLARAAPPTYAARVNTDMPIGYWRMGEPPGSLTTGDTSGNGSTGALSGGITLGQPGLHGGDTAALFDGRTGRIVVRNQPILNPASITMEAKIRWDGPNGFQQRILEKSAWDGGEQSQYNLTILTDDRVRVEIRTGLGASGDTICGTPAAPLRNVVCANSNALVARGVETHVVGTFDGRAIRIYLNGVLDSETAAGDRGGPIQPSQNDLGIGNQTQATRNRPFNGLIDEVAIFDRALSADQILGHYQSQSPSVTATGFQYAVKFVCGKSEERVVAPGEYFTAINVHNPNEIGLAFRKKFAIALPGEKAGRVSKFFDAKLGPDEAFEIDCPDILKKLDARGFVKGFAVIESRLELDVVAVYTAAGAVGRVETMDIETVKPRRIGGGGTGDQPDLIPVPDPAPVGFCKRNGLKLTVTVKNQGAAAAGPSTTTVDFSPFGTQSQPTPALAPGASVNLIFDIPPGCFDPDCQFRITVDSGGAVTESNEGNNFASGTCLG